MAQGSRTFTVVLEDRDGVLEENLTYEEENSGGVKIKKPHKKLQKRQTKKDFRDLMKNPSKFEFSELADPNHPTVVMRESPGGGQQDEVTFFYFEGFTIFFGPHPDIIEENETAPDSPFKNSAGTIVTFEAAANTGIVGEKQFKAGPYRVVTGAKNQKFWKFMVVTASGLTLDPCLITD